MFLTNREIVQSEISNWLKGDVSLHSMFSYNFASAILPFIQDDQGAAITVEGAYQVLNQKNICFIPFIQNYQQIPFLYGRNIHVFHQLLIGLLKSTRIFRKE